MGRLVVHVQALGRPCLSGGAGRRTLFEVRPARAVGIRAYSAFTGEDEYLLAPGTRLEVSGVKTDRSGLTTIALTELLGERLVR